MSSINQEPEKLSLFAVLLGSTPNGRNTEQHDVMFGVAKTVEELHERMKYFWHLPVVKEISDFIQKRYPETDASIIEKELLPAMVRRDKVHIDAWIQVNYADGYRVDIIPANQAGGNNGLRLYFINLGGYVANEFEEFHKKFFVVAANVSEALTKAKAHDFMKQYSAENVGKAGVAHLDDQHKIDFEADDIICVSDTLKGDYVLHLVQQNDCPENKMTIGYKKLNYAI